MQLVGMFTVDDLKMLPPIELISYDDESTRMIGTSVSTNKSSTTMTTTGTTRSCTTTEISRYKLIAPPANLTFDWWKHF